jgi:hypothetical protein
MRWLRRSIVMAGALALVAAPAAGAGTEQSNHAAARRDAVQLLARVMLPASAVPSAREPDGDAGRLATPGQVPAAVNVVDRRRWWTVPEEETDAAAFVRAHPTRGSALSTTGTGDGPGATSDSFTFALPSVRHLLGTRSITVKVTTLAGGGTGVRVDTEVQWLLPRPASERVPRAALALQVTVRRPHHAPISDVSITDVAKIRRIASLINALDTLQPGVFDCTGEADDPVLTFTFRSSPGGPVLARARQLINPGETGTPCDPMTLSIRARTRSPLVGGAEVLRAAQRLLGIRVPRP